MKTGDDGGAASSFWIYASSHHLFLEHVLGNIGNSTLHSAKNRLQTEVLRS